MSLINLLNRILGSWKSCVILKRVKFLLRGSIYLTNNAFKFSQSCLLHLLVLLSKFTLIKCCPRLCIIRHRRVLSYLGKSMNTQRRPRTFKSHFGKRGRHASVNLITYHFPEEIFRAPGAKITRIPCQLPQRTDRRRN